MWSLSWSQNTVSAFHLLEDHLCFADLEKAFEHIPRDVPEYGVSGPLLQATGFLYNHSESGCFQWVLYSVRAANHRTLILFIVFVDRISRRSQVVEVLHVRALGFHLALCR